MADTGEDTHVVGLSVDGGSGPLVCETDIAVELNAAENDSPASPPLSDEKEEKEEKQQLQHQQQDAPSVTISEVVSDPSVLSHFVFVSPDEGTPAAEALAANAAINVTKGDKLMHKLRGLKRPKLKSLNVMKQLHKYTKQNTDRSLSKNIKGKVIDGVHELYTLTAGMMLGMRVTIGHQSRPNESTALRIDDFTFVEKITFPAKGNNQPPYCTPPHSLVHTFKFKSYAPKVFKRLREYFSIDAASYMLSVCGNYNYLEFISNSKSGQFFFYSHDGKYMIKTQTKDENKFMKRILPHYYKYTTENPHTQMVRILGMHRVKMYHLRRKVHFVIMGSVFDTPQEIHTIYDLKGSLVGRAAKKKERENGGVLKDLDLLSDGRKLHMGPDKKRLFMEQLARDAYFLASLNIMDYSLLVGIHVRTRRPEAGGKAAAPGSVVSHSNTPFRRRAASDLEGDEGSKPPTPREGSDPSSGASSPSSPVSKASRNPRSASLYVPSSSGAGLLAGADGAAGGKRRSLNARRRSTPATTGPSPPLYHPPAGGAGAAAAAAGDGAGDRAKRDSAFSVLTEDLGSDSYEEAEDDEEDEEDLGDYLEEDEGDSDNDRDGGPDAPDGSPSGQGGRKSAYPSRIASPEGIDGRGLYGLEGSAHLSRIIRPSSIGNLAALVGLRATPRSEGGSDSGHNGAANGSTTGSQGSQELGAVLGGAAAGQWGRGSAAALYAPLSPEASADQPETLGTGTDGSQAFTYGPGQTSRHPWTSRFDNGINSRVPAGSPHSLEAAAGGGIFDPIPETEADSPRHSSESPGNSPLPRGEDREVRGDEIYYVGVIDILQQYNMHKRGENFLKRLFMDVSKISAVDPQTYARRFVEFMDANID